MATPKATKTTSKTTAKAPARVPAKAPAPGSTPGGAPTSAASGYSTYPLAELALRWQRNTLTAEQMLGHLLQHLAVLEQQLQRLERELEGS